MIANDMTDLAARWASLTERLELPEAEAAALYTDLTARYSAPGRVYHNLVHVHAILGTLDILASQYLTADTTALELAAWYHDVIYDTTKSDNEQRSADFMVQALRGFGIPDTIVTDASRLIELTAAHAPLAGDIAGSVLIDADLSILGAPTDVYDDYARSIRGEYSWVAPADYQTGRARVLENFLARERIYLTGLMFEDREVAARANLARELADLQGGAA